MQFAYTEAGTQKAALVKLRLCPKHALQLNYQKNQEALKVCCCCASHMVHVASGLLHLGHFHEQMPLCSAMHLQHVNVFRDLQAQEKRQQKEERRAAKRRKPDGDASTKRKRRRSPSPPQHGEPSPDGKPSDIDAGRQGAGADASQPLPAGLDADVDAVFAGLFE